MEVGLKMIEASLILVQQKTKPHQNNEWQLA